MDEKLCSGGGNKAKSWLGGDIYLNKNGQTIASTSYGFLNFEHCVGASSDDEFQLEASNDDGVCITSLSVNDNQLLVGKNNDLPNFWMNQRNVKCTNGHMTTSQITFKNGNNNYLLPRILSSQCKPVFGKFHTNFSKFLERYLFIVYGPWFSVIELFNERNYFIFRSKT